MTAKLRWRRLSGTLSATAAILLLCGHIGNPNTFYDGPAGPYSIHVVVQVAPVVPGLAEVSVRVAGARQVLMQPVYSGTGPAGAPPAEAAAPVPGAPGLWSGQLWLMQRGSYNVHVIVDGAAGRGVALVPIQAVSTRRLPMQPYLGWLMAALGVFLTVGLVSIVGSAIREAVVPPGESPDRRRRIRARVGMAAAAVIIAVILLGGWTWWNAEDAFFRRGLVHRLNVHTTVAAATGGRDLTFTITDPNWFSRGEERPDGYVPRLNVLVPEHGKLMHMFLLRLPAGDAFAHVHPVQLDSGSFRVRLPPIPAGRYVVFPDVVSEFGVDVTFVDTVTVPAEATGMRDTSADPDDSWTVAAPVTGAARLQDGSSMAWRHGPLRVGEDAQLHFQVSAPDGRPAALEPYLGMAGHAAIVRDDDAVFSHLHPMGSFAMASQAVNENAGPQSGLAGARAAAPGEMAMTGVSGSTVSFPYQFPEPGHYRVWVQVKRAGRVLTGAFEAEVAGR